MVWSSPKGGYGLPHDPTFQLLPGVEQDKLDKSCYSSVTRTVVGNFPI
jgi:hypothetical protein